MPESTKGGHLTLKRVQIPDEIRPGETYPVDVIVDNGAAFINPFDPDSCTDRSQDEQSVDGYSVVIEIEAGSQSTTIGPYCHVMSVVGANEEKLSTRLRAPEYGSDVSVKARLKLPGSGKSTGWVETSSPLDEDAPESPDEIQDPGEDPDDGDGSSNPFLDFPGADGGLSTIGAFTLVAAVLIIIWETQTG